MVDGVARTSSVRWSAERMRGDRVRVFGVGAEAGRAAEGKAVHGMAFGVLGPPVQVCWIGAHI